MGTCEVAAEPRDFVQIMLQVPLLWRSLIRHGMVQQGKFGGRHRLLQRPLGSPIAEYVDQLVRMGRDQFA